MSTGGADKRPTGKALTRRFALLSCIVIGLITVLLSFVISFYLRKDLLDREWGITADYIRSAALYHLTPTDFAVPQGQIAQEHFQAFYRQTVMMPEIVRVKIHDATMRVVWSDEPRLVGERFPDNPHLIGAIAGRTMVNIETDRRKGENVYEGQEFPVLVELYVPLVFPGTADVVGVVETYKVPAAVLANIRQGWYTVAGTALGGSALLYLSLFWIVRRAGRRIDEQHQALENRSRELSTANRELQTMQAQLLDAERMAAIGEVVAAVAHGIRNPLANIRAAAQVAALDCREGGESSLAAKHLTNIMAEVDRLEGRLKELLQFVRPTERHNASLDLNALLRGTVPMMAERLAKAGIVVLEQLPPRLPPIMGDAMLIEQVILSLLGNAIEAIPAGGGTITLATGIEPDERGTPCVFVEVRDTGVGIAAEEIPKIFAPFYTTKAQGTGLGLAIAKKFTEAHGGTMAVWSRPGEGACFRATFPALIKA
ncbi:MAG TPA: ATP-binding protein [Alphaproteobacteria bacterium]|nr:ATP-binding protein [Alphaproteobacteria bacterium]